MSLSRPLALSWRRIGRCRDGTRAALLAAALWLGSPAVHAQVAAAEAGDFLGTTRLSVGSTGLDGQWRRVRGEVLAPSLTARLLGAVAAKRGPALLAAVNAIANHAIRYVDDPRQYGVADHWATAAETLARGAGDCEDIAIVKLRLLQALGVPECEMFLTIGRQSSPDADHAVLVVRIEGRVWLLDNGRDQLVDAAGPGSFRPLLSFTAAGAGLHGGRRVTPAGPGPAAGCRGEACVVAADRPRTSGGGARG